MCISCLRANLEWQRLQWTWDLRLSQITDDGHQAAVTFRGEPIESEMVIFS